jgi:hypothetical protein
MGDERVIKRCFEIDATWSEYTTWLRQTRKRCEYRHGALSFELAGGLYLGFADRLGGGRGVYLCAAEVAVYHRTTPTGRLEIHAVMTEYGDSGGYDALFDGFIEESIACFTREQPDRPQRPTGDEPRFVRTRVRERRELVKKLYYEGLTDWEIVQRLGDYCEKTVFRDRKALGLGKFSQGQ